MSARRHPTDDALRAWLDDLDPDQAVEDHLGGCEICAGRLEALDNTLSPVASALELITRPPEGLRSRLDDRFAEVALQQATRSLIGDLFGIGFRTIRVLAEPEAPESPPPASQRPPEDSDE